MGRLDRSEVHRLVYRSRATMVGLRMNDLDIMRSAITRNARLGVTGFLLRNGNDYVQVLEGQQINLQHVFSLIEHDKRNYDVRPMSFEIVPERQFSGWSMGYERLPGASPERIAERLTKTDSAVELLLQVSRRQAAHLGDHGQQMSL